MKLGMRKLAGIALVVAVIVGTSKADEKKIKLTDLPEKVVAAVNKKFEGAKLKEAVQETTDKETLYEVLFTYKDHNYDVTLKPDGTITLIEKELRAAELPKAVTETLEKDYPKAELKKIEELTKGDT